MVRWGTSPGCHCNILQNSNYTAALPVVQLTISNHWRLLKIYHSEILCNKPAMPCNAMQQYPVHHYDHRMMSCLVGAKSVLCTLWQSWTSTTLCLSNFWSHLMLTMTSAFPYWMYMLTIVFLCRFSFYFPSNKQLFHFFFLITWPKNCICFCLVVISISSCICLQQDVIIVCLTLSPFIRPFFRWTWVSRYQNVSILLELRVMEVVVMTGVLDYI